MRFQEKMWSIVTSCRRSIERSSVRVKISHWDGLVLDPISRPKSCILAGHGSSHITADPTKQGRTRLQQFRPGGAIDGTAGWTTTPPVFGAIQHSYEGRNRGISTSFDVPTERWHEEVGHLRSGQPKRRKFEDKVPKVLPKNGPSGMADEVTNLPVRSTKVMAVAPKFAIQNGSPSILNLPKRAGFGKCEANDMEDSLQDFQRVCLAKNVFLCWCLWWARMGMGGSWSAIGLVSLVVWEGSVRKQWLFDLGVKSVKNM